MAWRSAGRGPQPCAMSPCHEVGSLLPGSILLHDNAIGVAGRSTRRCPVYGSPARAAWQPRWLTTQVAIQVVDNQSGNPGGWQSMRMAIQVAKQPRWQVYPRWQV